MTNHPPSVLWHCWLGHQTCKNRRPYNLYCVGADVKPCSITRIFLITNHQPLFHICIILPVESAPFFILSTLFCSLSCWLTSSCAYHLITFTTFALISVHLSLPWPFTPDLKQSSVPQILSSIVTLIPSGLPSWILACTELKGHWLCFSFWLCVLD